MRTPLLKTAILLCLAAPVFAEPGTTHYFDEETGRHLSLTEEAGNVVNVQFRFAGEPGYSWRWSGAGVRQDREIVFSRILGEDEPAGSKFVAKVGGSRVEIGFVPDQKTPQDEGFNGEYRRLSEDKRLSMARKDLKAADDVLKAALRSWGGPDSASAVEWMRRWAGLRARWTAKVQARAAAPAATPPAGAAMDAAALEKQADYWIVLTETTGQAIAFANLPVAALPMPADGTGDYDDGFGGRVGLRPRPDGAIHLDLGCQRGPDEGDGAQRSLDVPAESLVKGANGDWSAVVNYTDPERPGEPPAEFRIRKSGHYLWVDTKNGTRFPEQVWFDGIYRWGPAAVAE